VIYIDQKLICAALTVKLSKQAGRSTFLPGICANVTDHVRFPTSRAAIERLARKAEVAATVSHRIPLETRRYWLFYFLVVSGFQSVGQSKLPENA
jgi:hypothetical protein